MTLCVIPKFLQHHLHCTVVIIAVEISLSVLLLRLLLPNLLTMIAISVRTHSNIRTTTQVTTSVPYKCSVHTTDYLQKIIFRCNATHVFIIAVRAGQISVFYHSLFSYILFSINLAGMKLYLICCVYVYLYL